jgi:para-nitrobenzyl esterase
VTTSVEVTTEAGRLRGQEAGGIAVFLGIPFAAPPFGANRFRAPQPVTPWDGVRDALHYGAGSPQPILDPNPVSAAFVSPATQGEDCLNLNVWTPDVTGSGLPVMVWIHGGGFTTGSGAAPVHAGGTFARDGVVYVSINYRLHAEGFTAFEGGTLNCGLLDMVAALEWVQRNIAAFGGDPGNVTVFGQSGGAVGVMHLLAMPATHGLIRRAIAQSGSTEGTVSVADAEAVAKRYAEILGVAPTADAVRELPHERLVEASLIMTMEFVNPKAWGSRSFLISPFAGIHDGESLPELIVDAVRGGASKDVDLLAGATRDEASGFMVMHQLSGQLDDEWRAAAYQALGLDLDGLAAYREHSRPGATDDELIGVAWGDWGFKIPTLRLLEAHVPQPARTYRYEFIWGSPTLAMLGATHAIDIPFSTDMLAETYAATKDATNVLGDSAPQQLADAMHGAFIDFAKTGDPGWAQYDLDRRTTMVFDTESGLSDDPAAGERLLWEGIR